MDKQRELRSITGETLVIEEREGQASPVIQGYAALFNNRTNIYGLFTESIKPGAFERTLADNADVRALFNHDANNVLGRTKSGTLKLREDDKGLWMETEMPNTQLGRDVTEMIRRGDVTGQSFAFIIRKASWTMSDSKDQLDHRDIEDVELYDVGPVTYPAYQDTSIGVRSLAEEAYQEARKSWEEQNKPEEPVIVPCYQRQSKLLRVRLLRLLAA